MTKICVITTTRAEYGLLYWLMKGLEEDPHFTLQLVVTGTHLSAEFGSTIDHIRDDGFKIDRSFSMELKDDTPEGITNSLSVALNGFATAYKTLEPDLVIVLGDRYEILGAATAALIANVPVAHIHGGELSLGAIDDSIRHAVSKIAYFHFTATDIYKKRVIQLGEQTNRVLNVGGMGQDNIKKLPLLSKQELEKELNLKFKKKNFLITYHPETLNPVEGSSHFYNLLQVLQEQEEALCIFTMPNADAGHSELIELLEEFVRHNPKTSALFQSLGQLKYLSTMKQVDAVIGNSSSGIIEAPSMKVATIDIGDRQKGRLAASSVIHCEPDKQSISKAFKKLNSSRFTDGLKHTQNPYGNGGAATRIIKFLRNVKFDNLPPKGFNDLKP